MSNYDWFVRTNTSQYAGKWVVIANKRIAASGNDAEKVYRLAQKKFPRAKLSLAKVPDRQTLVLMLQWYRSSRIRIEPRKEPRLTPPLSFFPGR
ncbi:MAG: hypothetical protein HY747_09780 [Elusimicrobia bacterium]|nr:hypothetical protein [Elusimicrobiota bacterium]